MIDQGLKFNAYMSATARAAIRHTMAHEGLYHGAEGCRRLAREVAPALLDFKDFETNELIKCTYSGICVIAYNLKPPVDAGKWIGWIRERLKELGEAH